MSCTQLHSMEIENAKTRMIQSRMAYLQTGEYQAWASLENTKRLMPCYNTPEMCTKINAARENSQATSAYTAYLQAHDEYLALQEAS